MKKLYKINSKVVTVASIFTAHSCIKSEVEAILFKLATN